jgi:hypothetical protein
MTVSVVDCKQPLPPGLGGGGVGGGGAPGGKVFSVEKSICQGESYYYTLNVRAPDGSNSLIHVSAVSSASDVASANYDNASTTVKGVGLSPGVATITVTGQVEAVDEDIPFTMTLVVTVLDCKSVDVCKGDKVIVAMNGAAGATSGNANIAVAGLVAGAVQVTGRVIGSTVISVTGAGGKPVGRIKVTVKNCPPEKTPPRIAATPKAVAAGASATAHYIVSAGDQTKSAQIIIVSAGQRTPLGPAKQGTPTDLVFRAPDTAGTYQVQIISDTNTVLAADTFTVVGLITEIPLPAPNRLNFRHTNGSDVVWQGELTVKSFHVSTQAGTNTIYIGDATGDTPISTLSGKPGWAWGTGIELSLKFSFDNGKVVDSGKIGGTRGPDVGIGIPEGAERLTGIEVQASWTVFDYQTWKGSGPGSLRWSLDIPLAAMGMAAPAPKQR